MLGIARISVGNDNAKSELDEEDEGQRLSEFSPNSLLPEAINIPTFAAFSWLGSFNKVTP